jgi:thymidylate synthase (FAD)
VNVLNLGKIELVEHMGSDQSVVRAARISNGAVMPDWRGAPDEKLIRFLAQHKHMTPFEHNSFEFYVKAPIFVIREWQRHRTFSYNELSARYKKLKPEFYIPDQVRVPDPANKQSSIPVDNNHWRMSVKEQLFDAYTKAWEVYEGLVESGVAREIARAVLPVGIYSEMYVTGNLRNWMHFYKLRNSPDAQYEIRVYADAIGLYLQEHMPISFDALKNGPG